MKLQLISDVHSEFYKNPLALCASIETAPSLDFLVLAGDIVQPASQDITQVRGVFDVFSKRAKHTIFVCGNHCYYGGTAAATEFKLRSVMPPNYRWLENEGAYIDGLEFFGGAMWFPDDPLNQLYENGLSDFKLIRGFREWVYAYNRQFTEAA